MQNGMNICFFFCKHKLFWLVILGKLFVFWFFLKKNPPILLGDLPPKTTLIYRRLLWAFFLNCSLSHSNNLWPYLFVYVGSFCQNNRALLRLTSLITLTLLFPLFLSNLIHNTKNFVSIFFLSSHVQFAFMRYKTLIALARMPTISVTLLTLRKKTTVTTVMFLMPQIW